MQTPHRQDRGKNRAPKGARKTMPMFFISTDQAVMKPLMNWKKEKCSGFLRNTLEILGAEVSNTFVALLSFCSSK